ncbi:hypothetical protein MANES_15G080100v8 [Manihot esculenta]|uniref:Uncharacterized protein n=1 Tax=Manihot esculenta TaxID=3983 RepID=A0ACB7GAQ2_MANES|nr:hypothetical protein MANES_15G080100v8 [Manihot esculenta]
MSCKITIFLAENELNMSPILCRLKKFLLISIGLEPSVPFMASSCPLLVFDCSNLGYPHQNLAIFHQNHHQTFEHQSKLLNSPSLQSHQSPPQLYPTLPIYSTIKE